MSSSIIASVVIPCYGRSALLDRAIQSVIDCEGSERVEIIVIDDCSPEPVDSEVLREQDRVIRLEQNSGPSIGRNVGIEAAAGEMVYFLDSDDQYLDRNFGEDYRLFRDSDAVFYCEIDSQGFRSDYPDELIEEGYFDNIFFREHHIAQSSSLCFPKRVGVRFDESIRKHEDWDFIYCQALREGIPVKKISGRIFFDRSDRNSLSRRPDGENSLPWVEKICALNQDDESFDARQFRYHMLAQYPPQYPWLDYFWNTFVLLCQGGSSLRRSAIKGAHRLIALGHRIKGLSSQK
ncbi:MAG: glycosyltransferase family 2 protein [Verrucomicrobiota bacterium]